MNKFYLTSLVALGMSASVSAFHIGAGGLFDAGKYTITDRDFGRFEVLKDRQNTRSFYIEAGHTMPIHKSMDFTVNVYGSSSFDKLLKTFNDNIQIEHEYTYGLVMGPIVKLSKETNIQVTAGYGYAPVKYNDTDSVGTTKTTLTGPVLGAAIGHQLNEQVAFKASYKAFVPKSALINDTDHDDTFKQQCHTAGFGIEYNFA